MAVKSSEAPGRGERELFLDAIRAIAIIRVVAWHTFGVAAITYFVAAIPAMFFVTGSLLAKSMGRRSAGTVVADRFRRLLVPLWAFAAVAWLVMALAASRMGTDLPLHRALAWIFPLVDPHGSAWEGGWLSSHLWYVRTLVWLLLLSPLLLRAVRRLGAKVLLLPVAGVFVLDALSRGGGGWSTHHATIWAAGDLALYSVFLMVGFLHRDQRFRNISRRGWLAVAIVAAGAAVAWRLTQPVPLGVVNNSHPLHLFVGAGWLAVGLAGREALGRLAATRVVGGAVRAIGRRSLTIYLWHTAAIILALNVLDRVGLDEGPTRTAGLLALTVAGTLAATQLFGWVEDLAALRPMPSGARRLGRPAMSVATLAAVAGVALAVPSERDASVSETAAAARSPRRPPVPSQPPPPPKFEPAPAGAPSADPAPIEAGPTLAAKLEGMLTAWAEVTGVGGALVGIDGQGIRWSGAVGSRPDTGVALAVTDRIDLASLTKLFTATLVHQVAQTGAVDLDAPLPPLRSLPDFPYDAGITVAQLLDHTSGLVNYLDTSLYALDPDAIDGPVSAVMASAAHPLAAEPGTSYIYSSTNFLVLGLLLEEATGRTFDDLLHGALFGPLQLRDTLHLAPVPGWPRGATAGIETSLDDLLTAGRAILRDHVGLSDAAYARMTDVDPDSGFGPGTFGFCPCRLDDTGAPRFFAIGYYGATTLLGYVPSLDLTVAVDLVESLGLNGGYDSVTTLFEMLEDLARTP